MKAAGSAILAATLYAAMAANAAAAALPEGLSGSWYNPAQSGHGIHLEFLSSNSAIGVWNVYDPAGNPLHLYLEGEVDAQRRLVLEAFAPRGMRFGSFDRTAFSAPRWGSLSFEFSDCDSATMTYTGDGAAGLGFGSGSMPLKRLTSPAGTVCSFSAHPAQPSPGAYDGTFDRAGYDYDYGAFALHAAVDTKGRFWATTAWTPGPRYVSAVPYPPVFTAAPPAVTPDGLQAVAVVRYNVALTGDDWMDEHRGPILMTIDYRADANGEIGVTGNSSVVPNLVKRIDVAQAPGILADENFNVDSLGFKRFRFIEKSQFGEYRRDIVFGGNYYSYSKPSSICILQMANPLECELSGGIVATDRGLAMFDFILHDRVNTGRRYHGKGWVRGDTGELVMVAEGEDFGLGLIARPVSP